MSGKDIVRNTNGPGVHKVKVQITKPRRNTHGPTTVLETDNSRGIAKVSSRSADASYVYVNTGFVGSLNSVADESANRLPEPPTTVIREQYWACSRWPAGQKFLALAVGILLGALIGISITFALNKVNSEDIIGGIFRNNPTNE